jgi:hypothetical protein
MPYLTGRALRLYGSNTLRVDEADRAILGIPANLRRIPNDRQAHYLNLHLEPRNPMSRPGKVDACSQSDTHKTSAYNVIVKRATLMTSDGEQPDEPPHHRPDCVCVRIR